MSLSGLEPVKEEIITPAIEVATGQAEVEEVYQKYQGVELICPHCIQQWSNHLGNSNISEMLIKRDEQSLISSGLYTKEIIQALKRGLDRNGLLETIQAGVHAFPKHLRVRFRKGSLDEANKVSRWMHWVHTASKDGKNSKRPCHSLGCIHHAVAVGSFQLYLENKYKSHSDIEVLREKDLIITPGEPPLKRRPDLVVKQSGQIITIFEIQRSPISKDEFIERTKHLRLICPNVEWIFSEEIYDKMGPQRRWLSDEGLYYRCLFFRNNKIEVKEGEPLRSKGHKLAQKSAKSDCRFNGLQESFKQIKELKSEPFLPLSVVGPAIVHEKNPKLNLLSRKPGLPRWNCSVGDSVEVWIEGKWQKGRVETYSKPDVPCVRLSKGSRWVSPDRPDSIRLFQESRKEVKSQLSSQTHSQMSLFTQA
jgi:hypothetical protein